jgi:hypothetical protein
VRCLPACRPREHRAQAARDCGRALRLGPNAMNLRVRMKAGRFGHR